MHEISICERIVEVLEERSQAQAYERVNRVCLEVGELAGVEVDALRFGFDVVARGTIAQGAALEIIDIPGAAWCMHCACTVSAHQRFDPCPHCDGHSLRITGGEQLRIKSLEVQ